MRRGWCVVALVVLQCTKAPGAGAESLRESDFLDLIGGDHAALSIASEPLGAARAELARARALSNPIVDVERESPSENPAVSSLSVAWNPPLDGRRGARVRAARAGLDAAAADFESARLGLRRDVRASFAGWAVGTERRRLVEHHAALIDRLAEQIDARAGAGEESRLAARRVSLAALEVRAESAAAEAAVLEARRAAAVWAGRDLSEVTPALPGLPPVPEDTLSTDGRPDVRARRFELAEAEQRRRLAGRFLRFPEIRVGWQRIHDGSPSGAGPTVGLSWDLPLFDRDRADRVAVEAESRAAKARLDLARRSARAELEAARASYVVLRQSAERAHVTLSDADRAVESAVASFRLGESRLTDLLETLRSVLSARIAALDLLESALRAHRDLEVAAGRPLALQ
jgi:cobalt-zinc-cadmium efflux system outer membrane protein